MRRNILLFGILILIIAVSILFIGPECITRAESVTVSVRIAPTIHVNDGSLVNANLNVSRHFNITHITYVPL